MDLVDLEEKIATLISTEPTSPAEAAKLNVTLAYALNSLLFGSSERISIRLKLTKLFSLLANQWR